MSELHTTEQKIEKLRALIVAINMTAHNVKVLSKDARITHQMDSLLQLANETETCIPKISEKTNHWDV